MRIVVLKEAFINKYTCIYIVTWKIYLKNININMLANSPCGEDFLTQSTLLVHAYHSQNLYNYMYVAMCNVYRIIHYFKKAGCL